MHVKHRGPVSLQLPRLCTGLTRHRHPGVFCRGPTPTSWRLNTEGYTCRDGWMSVERLTAASLLFVNVAPPLKSLKVNNLSCKHKDKRLLCDPTCCPSWNVTSLFTPVGWLLLWTCNLTLNCEFSLDAWPRQHVYPIASIQSTLTITYPTAPLLIELTYITRKLVGKLKALINHYRCS